MKSLPRGILKHCPWDDPEWYPGKEYPPPPIERPDERFVLQDEPPDDNPRIPRPDACDARQENAPDVAAWPLPLRPMKMLQTAYLDIMRHLSSVPPEAGGMLLGPKGSGVVTHYVIDEKGKATAASFTLDAAGLNRVLKKALENGMNCKGLVHSHPTGCTVPSCGDLAYVRKAFANEKNKGITEFLLPIFCGGVLIPYIVLPREKNIVQVSQLILF